MSSWQNVCWPWSDLGHVSQSECQRNWTFLKMRSVVILSIQQFHRALFSKALHGGTTCLHGYAMDDNGKWIVCQHCRDKMRGSWPFGPDPSINSVVIWGLSQWCSRQSEAGLPRAGNWATQVANFFPIIQKKIAKRKKNDQRNFGKYIQKDISLGRQSEAGLPRAGNWAKQVSMAGKAPSSFLAQINYWSKRLLSHLHGLVHKYVQVLMILCRIPCTPAACVAFCRRSIAYTTPPATNNFYWAWRSPKKVLMQKSQKFCADFKYVNLKIELLKSGLRFLFRALEVPIQKVRKSHFLSWERGLFLNFLSFTFSKICNNSILRFTYMKSAQNFWLFCISTFFGLLQAW